MFKVALDPHVNVGQVARADPGVESRTRLLQLLKRHGVRERPVAGGGNCQFRALADQLYGAEDHHTSVRAQVFHSVAHPLSHFLVFVPLV